MKSVVKVKEWGYGFQFIFTQAKYFYGWDIHEIDGREIKMASLEKALIDLIQFHRTLSSTDLVLGILLNNQEKIDLGKLTQFLLKSNLATRRIFGFLLDCVVMDTRQLLNSVVKGRSVTCINQSRDNIYNHKWKLYYDQHFAKYVQ